MHSLRFTLIALLTLILVGCSSTERSDDFANEEQYDFANEEQYEFAYEEEYEFAYEEEYTPLISENYLHLTEIYLNASDVPGGYELNEIEPLDNFTIASSWPDPNEALQRYESWGRIEGYEVKFNKTQNLDINLTGVFSDIYVACSTFGDIKGATEDFIYEEQQREVVHRDYVQNGKGINYAVEPMHGVKIGEDSSSHKITYTREQGSGNIDIMITEVMFRTAYVVCRVNITVLDGKEGDLALADTELEYVAKNQDSLIYGAVSEIGR